MQATFSYRGAAPQIATPVSEEASGLQLLAQNIGHFASQLWNSLKSIDISQPAAAGAAAGTTALGTGISAPSTLVSMIPGLGSGWESAHYYSTGHWAMGTFYAAMAVLDLSGVGEIGGLALKGALKVAEKTIIKEGIYEFTTYTGKTYVGQSGNIAARIEQHLATRKLLVKDISSIRTTEVLGGKTAREIAEQMRINALGGIRGGRLDNIRNSIGPARQYLLP
jgi:hypothetical protein